MPFCLRIYILYLHIIELFDLRYCAAGSIMDLMGICRITLTESEIAVCMNQALQGLAYLHSNKIVHRDIKGANLLLSLEGECKLADFGVSKKLTNTLARTKTLIGTPYWMAPEVVLCEWMNRRYYHCIFAFNANIFAFKKDQEFMMVLMHARSIQKLENYLDTIQRRIYGRWG